MSFLYDLFVVGHMLGLAALLGGYFAVFRAPKMTDLIVWGARVQFLTGVVLVILGETVVDKNLILPKMATKLILSLVIVAFAEIGRAREEAAAEAAAEPSSSGTAQVPAVVSPLFFHAVGFFSVADTLVAVLWHR